jgi:hypothetical protein
MQCVAVLPVAVWQNLYVQSATLASHLTLSSISLQVEKSFYALLAQMAVVQSAALSLHFLTSAGSINWS